MPSGAVADVACGGDGVMREATKVWLRGYGAATANVIALGDKKTAIYLLKGLSLDDFKEAGSCGFDMYYLEIFYESSGE
jgi:hypothetical protein